MIRKSTNQENTASALKGRRIQMKMVRREDVGGRLDCAGRRFIYWWLYTHPVKSRTRIRFFFGGCIRIGLKSNRISQPW